MVFKPILMNSFVTQRMSKPVVLFLLCAGTVVAVGGIVLAIVVAVIRRRRQRHRYRYYTCGCLATEYLN